LEPTVTVPTAFLPPPLEDALSSSLSPHAAIAGHAARAPAAAIPLTTMRRLSWVILSSS
jgi:hypothetical protein